ncbi:ribbon-helix-helix protein, CopG family [Corynebacterium sp. HMSC034A01]|uniref:type II toxin-antitoxin system RelB family antitoxin n=1 Tax=Corynebacterium sp. HMSC034A01 TaxID=1739295 RepID=UPI0008A882CA|nr:ribbon-helix-helix domain-containing protein [Corynebacterium sp. HMSC034A01]OHR17907.1 hypothetical protein HMPREF2791_03960 [Corynebacterium sp. HMSC034A01]
MSGSVISLRVDEDQKRRLDALARRTGRPASYYVHEALSAHLAELEYVDELETEADAIRRGELPTISLEELENELGLAD